MITRNQIYDKIASSVNTSAHSVYCSSRYVASPPSFPACYIVNIDAFPLKNDDGLSPKDSNRMMTYEVQTFSKNKSGAETEAREIMGYAESSFREIGFYETMCRATENAEADIFRVVARFERVVGSDDTLPI